MKLEVKYESVIQHNAFEHVCKMTAILCRPQCVERYIELYSQDIRIIWYCF